MILTRTHTLVSPHQYVCCGKKCRWKINNKKKGMLQLYTLHVFAFLFLPFCDLTTLCGKEQSRLKIPFLSTWTAAFWKDKYFFIYFCKQTLYKYKLWYFDRTHGAKLFQLNGLFLFEAKCLYLSWMLYHIRSTCLFSSTPHPHPRVVCTKELTIFLAQPSMAQHEHSLQNPWGIT